MEKEQKKLINFETKEIRSKNPVEYLLRKLKEDGDKIKDPQKKMEYKKWVNGIEALIIGSPRADLNFYMSLPISMVIMYLKEKEKKIRKEYFEE